MKRKNQIDNRNNDNTGKWFRANKILQIKVKGKQKECLIEWRNSKFKPSWLLE
jgi:hypothetical protein